ncbi:MAG TPA: hypothetical protein VKU92_05730 [Acidimicrobiales bacterium]|nr:hypothetical protein [Acidimicrobiales bacterium]
MAELPVDARHVVDELRAIRQSEGVSPRGWAPSESFERVLSEAIRPPLHENEHLAWMHRNWDLGALLAPPPARGVRGVVRRLQHRLIMAVLAPYFSRLQEYLAVSTRAVDVASRRVDDVATNQLRMIGAVRHDMIDFAHYVDRRLDG